MRGTMADTLKANNQFSHAVWSDGRTASAREERFTYDKKQNITSRQGWFSGVTGAADVQEAVNAGEHTAALRWFWWEGDALMAEAQEAADITETCTAACDIQLPGSDHARREKLVQLTQALTLREYIYTLLLCTSGADNPPDGAR
ncbi:hypothetical protein [Enterobacter huaxiensis]